MIHQFAPGDTVAIYDCGVHNSKPTHRTIIEVTKYTITTNDCHVWIWREKTIFFNATTLMVCSITKWTVEHDSMISALHDVDLRNQAHSIVDTADLADIELIISLFGDEDTMK